MTATVRIEQKVDGPQTRNTAVPLTWDDGFRSLCSQGWPVAVARGDTIRLGLPTIRLVAVA